MKTMIACAARAFITGMPEADPGHDCGWLLHCSRRARLARVQAGARNPPVADAVRRLPVGPAPGAGPSAPTAGPLPQRWFQCVRRAAASGPLTRPQIAALCATPARVGFATGVPWQSRARVPDGTALRYSPLVR